MNKRNKPGTDTQLSIVAPLRQGPKYSFDVWLQVSAILNVNLCVLESSETFSCHSPTIDAYIGQAIRRIKFTCSRHRIINTNAIKTIKFLK